MASALVKFYNHDYLISDSAEKLRKAVKEDFQPYSIKTQINRLIILENQNSILCTLLYNSCYYEINEAQQLFQVYSNGSEKLQGNKQEFLIMEMKVPKEDHLKWLKEQFRQQVTFQKFRGPLSYEPIRQDRVSLLTSESPEQNYRGFMNLGILILILNHVRLIVENFLKYGLLIKDFPFFATLPQYRESPIFFALLVMLAIAMVAYGIQKLQFNGSIKPKWILYLNIANCLLLVTLPVYLLQTSHPTINVFLLGIDMILLLKLISYAHTLRNIKYVVERIREVGGKKIPVTEFFKENEITQRNLEIIKHAVTKPHTLVNFQHFMYFLAVPTYCFQLSYPRNQRIRKIWLLKRIVEFIGVTLLWIIVWYQYVEPLLNNTFLQFERDNYQINVLIFTERLMKLALPNTYLWITFFYLEFQLRCNIVAELLRFADRQFYLDWWNCKNMGEYWRLWNLPVHHWITRHLYFPMLKHSVKRWQANLVVFLVSALAHEFVISASLGIIEFWAFFGMMTQAPVILCQEKIEKTLKLQNSQLGNVMFWISFCFLGQPLLIFVYYYHFLQKQKAFA